MSYIVSEVFLASVIGAVVFAVFAAQLLVIVGITGPITVFNYTVYDIMTPTGVTYFAFMCLIGLWSFVIHCMLAFTNSCNALKYVIQFSCDIFGFYVAFFYLQKGIQVLTRQVAGHRFCLSIMIALLLLMVDYFCGLIGTGPLFQHCIRVFIKDYGTPLTVVFFTGFVHIGKVRDVSLEVLPTSKAFFPTTDRGLLGILFPKVLIPQVPFHTDSLCVTKVVADLNEEGANKGHVVMKVDHVVEQRFSKMAQGLLTLGTMSGPFLVVLHLIPQGVLAGLFFVLGVQALKGNGINLKMLFLCRDKSLTPVSEPLKRIRRRPAIWIFVAMQLLDFRERFGMQRPGMSRRSVTR